MKNKILAGLGAIALLTVLFAPNGHAWFFETDVDVTTNKTSSQSAGRDANTDSFNRSQDIRKSFNTTIKRNRSHDIGGDVKSSIISGEGVSFKSGKAVAKGSIDIGNSTSRYGWGSNRSFIQNEGDGNNYSFSGHSASSGNYTNFGDSITIDKRSNYSDNHAFKGKATE